VRTVFGYSVSQCPVNFGWIISNIYGSSLGEIEIQFSCSLSPVKLTGYQYLKVISVSYICITKENWTGTG
jgi:hypothetical protein